VSTSRVAHTSRSCTPQASMYHCRHHPFSKHASSPFSLHPAANLLPTPPPVGQGRSRSMEELRCNMWAALLAFWGSCKLHWLCFHHCDTVTYRADHSAYHHDCIHGRLHHHHHQHHRDVHFCPVPQSQSQLPQQTQHMHHQSPQHFSHQQPSLALHRLHFCRHRRSAKRELCTRITRWYVGDRVAKRRSRRSFSHIAAE
jgi:hypothetical protein